MTRRAPERGGEKCINRQQGNLLPFLLKHFLDPPLIVVFGFTRLVEGGWHCLPQELDRARGEARHTEIQLCNIWLRQLISDEWGRYARRAYLIRSDTSERITQLGR